MEILSRNRIAVRLFALLYTGVKIDGSIGKFSGCGIQTIRPVRWHEQKVCICVPSAPVRFAQSMTQIKSYLLWSAHLFQWKPIVARGFWMGMVHYVIRPVQLFLYGQIVFCADVLLPRRSGRVSPTGCLVGRNRQIGPVQTRTRGVSRVALHTSVPTVALPRGIASSHDRAKTGEYKVIEGVTAVAARAATGPTDHNRAAIVV